MPEDNGDNLKKQLQLILKVLAAYTVQGKSLMEGAKFLDRLGVDRSIIAEIYDTTPSSVRSRLSEAKKSSGSKTKRVRARKDVK